LSKQLTIFSAVAPVIGAMAASLAQTMPDLKDPNTIAAGRQVFEDKRCTYCHGTDGNGGIKLAGRTDLEPDYVFQTISEGRARGSLRMPSWRGVLSDQQIWQATAYVLSLAQQPK
jgi:mono/diheme cytochrome c family protein